MIVPLEYHKNSWMIMNLKPVEVIYVNPLEKGTFIAKHLKHQKTASAKYSPVLLFVDERLGRFKKSRVSIFPGKIESNLFTNFKKRVDFPNPNGTWETDQARMLDDLTIETPLARCDRSKGVGCAHRIIG